MKEISSWIPKGNFVVLRIEFGDVSALYANRETKEGFSNVEKGQEQGGLEGTVCLYAFLW